MKLYDSRRAPNPRRVRWVLAEKSVEDLEIVQVDLLRNEHREPDFLKRIGMASVPALEMDDETVITESLAICRYLESLYPEPNLFGHDPKEVAIIEMWTRRSEMLLATPLMMAVRHAHPALAALETQIPQVALASRDSAERALNLFDRRLAVSEFIGSSRVTMADIVAFIALDFARMVQFRPSEELVHFNRWSSSMRARPAASAGL